MLSFYKKKIGQWSWYDFEEVVSTNDTIKELAPSQLPAVISAKKQSHGRGRCGRKWLAIEGNLYFTFSLQIMPQNLSRYVCLIGLSMAKTLQKLAPLADIKIKWPNDIFLFQKKITGILIENICDDIWAVGIGVNIVSSPNIKDMPYQATSLKENGINIERTLFLESYLSQFSSDLALYQEKGFSEIREQWLQYALNLGQTITIKNNDYVKNGVFLTLDENGYLILKMEQGEERIIAGDLFI